MAIIQRGFKTELNPNNKQVTLLRKNCGASRLAYNWALEQKKLALQNKTKLPSAISLHRELNLLKKTDWTWAYQVSKCSFQEALRNLDSAFNNFWKSRKGQRKGKKVEFPKKKTLKKGRGSFRLTGSIIVFDDSIQLPRLGVIKLKEFGYLPKGVKILSATVRERANRWFVSILTEIEQPEFDGIKDAEDIIGVDLGIKTLATCSDGTVFENPKPLKRGLRKIKRLQRIVSRRKKGGKNRRKAVRKLGNAHFRIANIRKDVLHKITTTLAKTKRIVCIEDLNVAGMLKNHRLAQAISDVGFGEFRRQLDYKAILYGCTVMVADRFFASSKICSDCGMKNTELTLADREWTCSNCDEWHDRDINAAINLRNLAVSSTESSKRPMEVVALAS